MFKLELLPYIRIYPIFYILFLKKVLENVKRGLVYIDKKTQELVYKVDYIIEHKLV